jgi:hypothetical protein
MVRPLGTPLARGGSLKVREKDVAATGSLFRFVPRADDGDRR